MFPEGRCALGKFGWLSTEDRRYAWAAPITLGRWPRLESVRVWPVGEAEWHGRKVNPNST